MTLLRLALLALALMVGSAAPAQDLQPVPPLNARVTDLTGTLGGAQRQALEDKLAAFEASAGSQLAVLIVGSTQPEDIAAYAQRVGEQWKIGRRDVGDGLLIVVAKNDRKVRIEVAKALEGAVPDLAAKRIIDDSIRPAFRAGDYAGGLNLAVDQLSARIRGEKLPAPGSGGWNTPQPGSGFDLEDVAIFLFVGVPIAGAVLTGIFGRKLGSLLTAGGAGGLAWWVTASVMMAAIAAVVALIVAGIFGVGSAGRRVGRTRPTLGDVGGSWGGSWGGGGGGDSGGFSSGGGGDFGGGGASGDW
jgi:uncharacterized protein